MRHSVFDTTKASLKTSTISVSQYLQLTIDSHSLWQVLQGHSGEILGVCNTAATKKLKFDTYRPVTGEEGSERAVGAYSAPQTL